MKKIACFLAFLLLFTLAFSGCGRSKNFFYYDVENAPVNLDPQSAADYSSHLVISNIFEGLLAVDGNGELVPAAAERYVVSEGGLTYHFYLREDGKWADDSPVTAADFVYAFQRLFNPDTNAPQADQFFCIQNSKRVLTKELAPSELGVRASGEYELKIELEYYNSRFLELLTTAPAMPCKKTFFEETRGKYGLAKDKIMGNGALYLQSWESSFLRLRKNGNYQAETPLTLDSLQYSVLSNMDIPDRQTTLSKETRFAEGRTSAVATNGDLNGIVDGEDSITRNRNSVWGVLFNLKRAPFTNENVRVALSYDLNRERISKVIPGDLSLARAIVPENIRIAGENYRMLAGNNLTVAYSVDTAKTTFQTGLQELELNGLEPVRMILPEGGGHAQYFAYIAQVWQRDLGFYITVEELSVKDYQSRLKSGDFDCALVELTSAYNSPHAILSTFSSQNGSNYASFADADFDQLLKDAEKESDVKKAAESYEKAERYLLDKTVFLPFYYQSEAFIQASGVSGVSYNFDTKIVDFRYGEIK